MSQSNVFIFGTGAMVFLFLSLLVVGESDSVNKEVVVRGSVVCVDESGSEISCHGDDRLFALRTADGNQLFLLPEDPNSRMFEDERLRQREVEIRGWPRGKNRLEIIKVHSVKDGQLFDIHYFCSVCNIKAFVGGLCWCCQEEFEFREVSVDR